MKLAKNKISLEFSGFEEMIAKLDELDGDVKGVVEDCLKTSQDIVADNLTIAMKKHHRTGRTEDSIKRNTNVEWDGMTASIGVGFQFQDGLPSVFLMYGTPRMKKDTKLYNAVYGKKTRNTIADKQEKIFFDAVNDLLGD